MGRVRTLLARVRGPVGPSRLIERSQWRGVYRGAKSRRSRLAVPARQSRRRSNPRLPAASLRPWGSSPVAPVFFAWLCDFRCGTDSHARQRPPVYRRVSVLVWRGEDLLIGRPSVPASMRKQTRCLSCSLKRDPNPVDRETSHRATRRSPPGTAARSVRTSGSVRRSG